MHIIINRLELIRKQIDIAFIFMHDQFRFLFFFTKIFPNLYYFSSIPRQRRNIFCIGKDDDMNSNVIKLVGNQIVAFERVQHWGIGFSVELMCSL